MKRLLVSVLLVVCATPVASAENLSVQVVSQPEQEWQFQRLSATSDQPTTRVTGRLTANQRFGLPSGHIDVAAYTPAGELIAETTTHYVPAFLTYKVNRKGGVRFSSSFGRAMPSRTLVKVAFHRDEPRPKVNPPHNGNIAR